MLLLILYLSLALIVSFLCSIMEAVLLSTTDAYIIVNLEKGEKWAKIFSKLKKNIGKSLSAILSLNTIAHTVGAAGVGAQAVKVFGNEYFGLVSAILTILILVITEIIPKTIGARYWKNLTKGTAYIIQTMIIISYPLVVVSEFITKLISSREQEKTTSREEIEAMANIGASEGVFSSEEHKIINNVLKLKNLKVSEIMTPRVVVVVANEEAYLKDFLNNKKYLSYSRIPVFSENEENITGYVIRQKVMEKLAEDKHELKLKDIKRKIVVAPNTVALFSIWEQLLEKAEHIALIVDEYGGFDGIVTMEDIIESLLGMQIVDETDTIPNMQKYARDRWKARQAKYKKIWE